MPGGHALRRTECHGSRSEPRNDSEIGSEAEIRVAVRWPEYGGVAQLGEQRIYNPQVEGSRASPTTSSCDE